MSKTNANKLNQLIINQKGIDPNNEFNESNETEIDVDLIIDRIHDLTSKDN